MTHSSRRGRARARGAARALATALGVALLIAAPPSARATSPAGPARHGAEYLVDHQAADGTFFGDTAPHRVAETLVAVVAGGISGAPVTRALAYIDSQGPDAADKAGEAGLLVLGIVAGGQDPHDFGGNDYVAKLRSFYDEATGAYDTQMFQNALALLGTVAGGEDIPDEAITFLRVNRCVDGGIPIQPPCGGGGGHVDVTALVLNALVGDGMAPTDSLRADARSFLVAAQNDEGGFGDGKDKPTNSNSTGLALTAIAALGESAEGAPWHQADGDDPVEELLALQEADGGFRQSAAAQGDRYLATRQAVPGAAGRAHPVLPAGSEQENGGTNPTGGSSPSGNGESSEPLSTARATPESAAATSSPSMGASTGASPGATWPTGEGSTIAIEPGSDAGSGAGRPITPIAGAGVALAGAAGLLGARRGLFERLLRRR